MTTRLWTILILLAIGVAAQRASAQAGGFVTSEQCSLTGTTEPSMGIKTFHCQGGNCVVGRARSTMTGGSGTAQTLDRPANWEFTVEPSLWEIRPDGPAAGRIQDGDLLVAVNGLPITTQNGSFQLTSMATGVPLKLQVRRAQRLMDVEITPVPACWPITASAGPESTPGFILRQRRGDAGTVEAVGGGARGRGAGGASGASASPAAGGGGGAVGRARVGGAAGAGGGGGGARGGGAGAGGAGGDAGGVVQAAPVGPSGGQGGDAAPRARGAGGARAGGAGGVVQQGGGSGDAQAGGSAGTVQASGRGGRGRSGGAGGAVGGQAQTLATTRRIIVRDGTVNFEGPGLVLSGSAFSRDADSTTPTFVFVNPPVVESVTAGGIAERAGIQVGDIVNGVSTDVPLADLPVLTGSGTLSLTDVRGVSALSSAGPGRPVMLTITRNGEQRQVILQMR